jgi:GNAT superfamily N-acetyltransferase
MSDVSIRLATYDDIPVIVKQRRQMFLDMGSADVKKLDVHDQGFDAWVRVKLPPKEYVGWVADAEGKNVGGAGLWIMAWPPHPADPTARRGCVMNVYVDPIYRRQGLARSMVMALLAWSREHSVRILILNASHEGRGLYESLGFTTTNEMTLLMAGEVT